MNAKTLSFWGITLRTIAAHTLTYFAVGLIAFSLFDYTEQFADPALSSLMRPTDDPLVQAGVLFQPIRGILFGIVFYLLRDVLFRQKDGWLVMWVTLVVIGIFSPFGTAPGSIEGFIYTKVSFSGLGGGMLEVLSQSFLFSVLTFYWVNQPEKRWLNWLLGTLFFVALLLPALGLLAGQLSSQKWWYLAALGVIAASFFSPLDPLRSGHLPGKPSFYAPDGLLRSAAGLEPTPGGVAGRFDGSSPDGGGAAVRFADGREMSSLYSLLAGILFIPSLALSLGVWTGSSKAFEVLSVLFWYLGPLNKVVELDYVGIHSTDYWGIYFFMSGILTLLAFTGRWRQIQGK